MGEMTNKTQAAAREQQRAGRALRAEPIVIDLPAADEHSMLIRIADLTTTDPATDDDVGELVERVVRRAQYLALREVLGALDGWIEGAASNHEALGHRDTDCCATYSPDDVRRMVNDAADELRVPRPYRSES